MGGWVLVTPQGTRACRPRKFWPQATKEFTAFTHQSRISILTIPSHIYWTHVLLRLTTSLPYLPFLASQL